MEARRRPFPRAEVVVSGRYRRGFTIVRIVDQALVQQSHIEELGCDLMDLIDVGNAGHPDFLAVMRLEAGLSAWWQTPIAAVPRPTDP